MTEFRVDMENITPPPSEDGGMNVPVKAERIGLDILVDKHLAGISIAEVAEKYIDDCTGGDKYENNCAHFLSNAFIEAGYSELLPPNDHVNARCISKRPIRARELWQWFQEKSTESTREVIKGSGWWVAFQLNESAYWGGHVVILDTDKWRYYGTGVYYSWDQYLYRW